MVLDLELKVVFDSFSSLGAPYTAGVSSASSKTMTLEQLKELNQTHHLNLWTKDIQNVFDEVRYKNDQQINFQQFQDALLLFSRIKYPRMSPELSYQKLSTEITQNKNVNKRFRAESSSNLSLDRIPRSVALSAEVATPRQIATPKSPSKKIHL